MIFELARRATLLFLSCSMVLPSEARASALLDGVAETQAGGARAPECALGAVECGRAAFARGTESFDRAEYARAEGWFSAAAKADPHPVVQFNLALARARAGKFVAARAGFAALLGEPRLDAALRARAEREQMLAEASIARVRFELANRSSRVFVDDVEITVSTLELPLDPGVHRFRVLSANSPVFEQNEQLSPGERLSLRVSSRARALEVVVVGADDAARPAARRGEGPSGGVAPIWFIASVTATGLLAGATLWSGLDVQRAYANYRDDLPRLSQTQADDRVKDGHARETRTNVLLAVTGVAAVGSAALGIYWVDWSGSSGLKAAQLQLVPTRVLVTARF